MRKLLAAQVILTVLLALVSGGAAIAAKPVPPSCSITVTDTSGGAERVTEFYERPEHADMVYVSGQAAEAIASGDWDNALQLARVAEELSQGGFLVAEHARPGECHAITRDAQPCRMRALRDDAHCRIHAPLIQAYYDRRRELMEP